VPNDVWLAVHLPSVQSAGGVKKVIKLGVWTGLSEVRVTTMVTGLADSAAAFVFVGVCVITDVRICVVGSADDIFVWVY
jgi:hypothetical protein